MKPGKEKAVLGLLTVLLASGCVTRRVVVHDRVPVQPVLVVQEPPPPRSEVVGVAPSSAHVWVPGYWQWTGRKYVWHGGHWEKRPTTGATYVEGHWEKQPQGWVWVPGMWR